VLKDVIRSVGEGIYQWLIIAALPLNLVLAKTQGQKFYPGSVLHISYMVHIPYYTVRVLRKAGVKADYLAVGPINKTWYKSDFHYLPSRWPHKRAIQEVMMFWRIVARYEIIHSHFMISMSHSGWEWGLLKRLGRKIVIHYRGCEIRNKDKRPALDPEHDICQACDYGEYCTSDRIRKRRRLARKYGDAFLVTTPDLKEFFPEAVHLPFFSPVIERFPAPEKPRGDMKLTRILHVTNHPGIEGTEEIRSAVTRLQAKGYPIELTVLGKVAHEKVLEALLEADISIGKMKMGYYANFQIESMLLGVPAMTYVRPEFMADALKESGFIFCDLNSLEQTLQYYLDHPEKLKEKKRIAKESILKLHDNEKIAERLISIYRSLGQSCVKC